MIKPPIYLDYAGDLGIYASIERAELQIEPPDIYTPGHRFYDSQGHLLKAVLRPTTSWFTPGQVDWTQVMLLQDDEPKYQEELAAAIRRLLEHCGHNTELLREATLEHLVALSLPYVER